MEEEEEEEEEEEHQVLLKMTQSYHVSIYKITILNRTKIEVMLHQILMWGHNIKFWEDIMKSAVLETPTVQRGWQKRQLSY
jgi:hypothetical protein